jgi:hypothetical protein
MSIEIGLLSDGIEIGTNTRYAPLAALSAQYQYQDCLKPLEKVDIGMKTVRYSPRSKLQQVLLSILSGCEYLAEVNSYLKPECALAQVWQLDRFADQSMLSRTLDKLTLMNIEQLRAAETAIWRQTSRVRCHDWRGYLWLDYDLSGLPSTKGYFSGKKTSRDAS